MARARRFLPLLVTIILLPVPSTVATAGTNLWTAIGPYGGGAVVVAPSNPDIVFAFSHGVFKSINGGKTWHHLYPTLDGQDIWSLAVDPHDAKRVFLATGEGVWTSTDGGISWQAPPPTFAIGNAMVVDPTNPLVIYAGLYKSSDGGQSWQLTGLSQASGLAVGDVFAVYSLAVDPVHPLTVYAGIEGAFCGCGLQTSSVGGVWKSLDGGVTWAPKDKGLPANLSLSQYYVVIDPARSSHVYLLVAGLATAYSSTDGGETWTLMEQGAHALAAGPGGTVYTDAARSADGGRTWAPFTAPPLVNSFDVVADPVSPLGVFAAAYDGVVKSVDGGATWRAANGGLTTNQVTAFAIDPSDPRTIYAGTAYHFFKTTAGGGTWQEIRSLPPYTSVRVSGLVIDPDHPATLYLAAAGFGEANGIAKSVDGGATWQIVDVQAMSILIDPAVTSTLYATVATYARGCDTFRSVDSGANWSCLASRQDAAAVYPDPLAPGVIYALGARGEFLYKSVDDGISWHRADRHGLAKVQYDSELLIDPTDTKHLLITVGTGLYGSSNAAGTWAPVLPGPADHLRMIVMDPRATSHLYALDQAYSVLGSVDGGQHWTALDSGRSPFTYADAPGYPQGTPTRLLQIDPADSATLYLADYGLYKLTQSPAP